MDDLDFSENHFKDIAPQQIAYFGGPGKMLIPSRATVEAMIRRIPRSKVLTTDLLRQRLADDFEVQGTCPVTTRKILKIIANDPQDTAYWRVVKQKGELIDMFPGGVGAQAALLEDEGVAINSSGKAPKVDRLKDTVAQID
jgi:alkylated DNA nucleotide flippase Atl1